MITLAVTQVLLLLNAAYCGNTAWDDFAAGRPGRAAVGVVAAVTAVAVTVLSFNFYIMA